MIVPPPKNTVNPLFMYRGTTVKQTWPRIATAAVVSIMVTVAYTLRGRDMSLSITPLPFQLIGLALSIFLAFLTKAAYDRWWEGRKLWGGVVNVTRTIARQAQTFLGDTSDPEQPSREEVTQTLVLRTIAWTHALRLHLRPGSAWDRDLAGALAGALSDDEIAELRSSSNVPIEILRRTGLVLRGADSAGQLTNYELVQLEASIGRLTDLQGGCERIRNTPIPWGYPFLLSRLVFYYCVLLPFGIVDDIGIMTPVVTLFVAVALFGLAEIAGDIQDPFGDCVNSLPMHALATTIETNLREALAQPPAEWPAAIEPVGGVLR